MRWLSLFFLILAQPSFAASPAHFELGVLKQSHLARATVTFSGGRGYITHTIGKRRSPRVVVSESTYKNLIKMAEGFGKTSLLEAKSNCPRSLIYLRYTTASGSVRRFSSCWREKSIMLTKLQAILDQLANYL